MPHTFKANPAHPAVAYLVRLHADIGGKILENRKEAKRLAESMKHVEHVIRLFDPAYNVRRIAARRRYTSKLTLSSIRKDRSGSTIFLGIYTGNEFPLRGLKSPALQT